MGNLCSCLFKSHSTQSSITTAAGAAYDEDILIANDVLNDQHNHYASTEELPTSAPANHHNAYAVSVGIISPGSKQHLTEPLLPSHHSEEGLLLPSTAQLAASYCDFAFLNSRVQQWVGGNDNGGGGGGSGGNKVLIIARGVPGSGKSFLVKQICRHYPRATVHSADHFFLQPDTGTYVFDANKLKQAHNRCHNNVFAAMQAGQSPVVVDNTNVRTWEFRYFTDLSRKFAYLLLVVSPKTPWRFDAAVCAAKNQHGASEEYIASKISAFEPTLPLYFGWFLDSGDSQQCMHLVMELWQMLLRMPDTRALIEKDFVHTTGQKTTTKKNATPQPARSLEDWFTMQEDEPLHCTAKFCLYGRANGAREYCSSMDVWNAQGELFDLVVKSFLITPRTCGTVMTLPGSVLPPAGGYDAVLNSPYPLWQGDDNQIVYNDGSPGPLVGASREPGCRAHVTLGTAANVQAVQTGLDVLQVWDIQHSTEPSPDAMVIMTQWGMVQYLDQGRFLLQLDQPMTLSSMFCPRY